MTSPLNRSTVATRGDLYMFVGDSHPAPELPALSESWHDCCWRQVAAVTAPPDFEIPDEDPDRLDALPFQVQQIRVTVSVKDFRPICGVTYGQDALPYVTYGIDLSRTADDRPAANTSRFMIADSAIVDSGPGKLVLAPKDSRVVTS